MDWELARVRRHLYWARTQGVRRLIEEDDLDPIKRVKLSMSKARWRRRNDYRPLAMPIFIVGVQRSGTNMLVRGLEQAPEFEVRNENDRQAFDRFVLRSDDIIRDIVVSSRHRYVLFKPLCDSHRVTALLDELGSPSPGRAVWAFRNVDGRVRSAVVKFGDANLRALWRIADGTGDHLWQAQGLTARHRELIRGADFGTMTPEDAAALFWYLRNDLYFTSGLEARDDVTLLSYDAMIAEPEAVMRSLCDFIGFDYDPGLIAHIEPRTPTGQPLPLNPEIRGLCDALTRRLQEEAARRLGG